MAAALVYGAVCLLGYAVVQKRLDTTPVTGPIVFVALGLLAGSGGLGIIEADFNEIVEIVDVVFQATLILLLFTGAAALHLPSWRLDAARMLVIGLPLTIAFGALIAAVLFTDLGIWEAAIIGAIIAPTDAALGQAVISNPRVPERIRQALDIESGLNDGVSLPFVLIFIGLADPSLGTGVAGTFLGEIGFALIVGVVVGFVGGWLLVRGSESGWMGRPWSGIAMIAIAVIAFIVADGIGGSGFIATFVAGLSYGSVTRDRINESEVLATHLGLAMVQISFLAFGALVLWPVLGGTTWQVVLMAVLALTIARIAPIAVSMVGRKLSRPTVLYLGWFGPRGLATLVFAVLVVTDADLPGTDIIVNVAAITVGLSVLVHGLTAYWGSQRYADWYESHYDTTLLAEAEPVTQDETSAP